MGVYSSQNWKNETFTLVTMKSSLLSHFIVEFGFLLADWLHGQCSLMAILHLGGLKLQIYEYALSKTLKSCKFDLGVGDKTVFWLICMEWALIYASVHQPWPVWLSRPQHALKKGRNIWAIFIILFSWIIFIEKIIKMIM